MIRDLDVARDITTLQRSKLLIYGTGKNGKDFMHLAVMLGAEIIGWCDSDIQKKGNVLEGYKIYHYSDLEQLHADNRHMLIVVASMYFDEIIKTITNTIPEADFCTEFSAKISIFLNYKKLEDDKKTLKNFINRLIDTLYSQTFAERKFDVMKCFWDISNQSIIVYSVGKVGSTTLANSLESQGIYAAHCHSCFSVPFIEESAKFRDYRDRAIKNYKGKIIVPIREPISRDISQYFQLLQVRIAVLCRDFAVTDILQDFTKIYYNSLVDDTNYNGQVSLQGLLFNNTRKGLEFDWFDHELKKFTGIDVYNHPFDREKGYAIYDDRVMVVQLEKMDALEQTIGEFCGVPNLQLAQHNTATTKKYQYLYEAFKENLVLPKEYIDFYYKDNPWLAHFYSEDDMEVFYAKWMKKCRQ